MEIIPSIDLRNGRCVRLYQGDYARETVFSEDPVGTAQHWESLGAARLHVVDLDGAASGRPFHLDLVNKIAVTLRIPVQIGGGIRTLETVSAYLSAGVKRVVLGTAAIENQGLLKEACQKYGESIAVGVDAKDGFVAVHGWKDKTSVAAFDLIREMEAIGARRFIYTDISRDGTLSAPNFASVAEVIRRAHSPVIASGGVTSIEHLKKLRSLRVEGAIIGRALYTGDIKLDEALEALAEDGHRYQEPGKDGA